MFFGIVHEKNVDSMSVLMSPKKSLSKSVDFLIRLRQIQQRLYFGYLGILSNVLYDVLEYYSNINKVEGYAVSVLGVNFDNIRMIYFDF